MATVTLPTTYATSAPYDDLTPANLNGNLEALRDGINSIATAQLENSAVTTAKIADNAVTNAKLADDAVDTAELADGAVEYANIAAATIGGDKINVFDQESGSPAILHTAAWTVAHGLQDENGVARIPSVVLCYIKETINSRDCWVLAGDNQGTADNAYGLAWDDTNIIVENATGESQEFRVIAF